MHVRRTPKQLKKGSLFLVVFIFALLSLMLVRELWSDSEPKIFESSIQGHMSYARLKENLFEIDVFELAKRDFEKGNHGFIGIRGYSVSYPGISEEKYMLKSNRVIAGTSDNVRSHEGEDWNQAAYWFAKEYNEEKLKLIGQTGMARD